MNFYSFTSYFERLKFDSFKTEDDMNAVDYTEVDFSHYRATNSAPCGNAIYVCTSSPGTCQLCRPHADASPPHMSKNISSDAADESLVANR